MARALPDDGKRYEVLNGELFVTTTPSPQHQRAVGALLLTLAEFTRQHRVGETLMSPSDIEFSPVRLVQPDVFVVPGGRITDWRDIRGLALAVEVLSPFTARADRVVKRKLYQSEGVPDYWIVDVEARLFECWQPGEDRPSILSETLVWHPVPSVHALEIDLDEYFTSVTD